MIYLVTGGSRGLGAAIVLEAVAQGHDVAFTYLNSEEAAARVARDAVAQRPDALCRAYRMDVRDPAEVEQVGDRILTDFDRVDVVVNNAGITRDNIAAYMSDEEWQDVIATNLSGPFYVCRHFIPSMLIHKFGRIINISSTGARGVSGQVNYAASKAGLYGLTRTLAKELGARNITANLVVPGLIDSEMAKEAASASNREMWLTYCPAQRLGRASEVVAAVLFLGSEAAGYTNGESIRVDGGLDYAP